MRNIVIILFVLYIFSACTNQKVDSKKTEDGIVQLSAEQIILSGIKIGKIEKRKISETVECTGILDVDRKDRMTISPGINGFLNDFFLKEGDFVKAGKRIASLSHSDFITLQQQYLENKSKVRYFEQEFKRKGELTVENAASIKNLQKAQSDYWTAQYAYKSSKIQLEMLGVNIDILDKDEFVKYYYLTSPISGYIININGNKGKFIETKDIFCEIINPSTLTVNINILEKDFNKIKAGQKVEFYQPFDTSIKYLSKIENIGVIIDKTNKTLNTQCKIENADFKLHVGIEIQAIVYISEKETFVLPTSAVTTNDKSSFIFIKKENGFVKRQVNVGIEQNNFVEILTVTDEILNSEIVINGVYYLLSDSETNE